MITRRDALKLAAAAGVAGAAVPFALTPEEAAAALDAPLDAAPLERDPGFRRDTNDPYDPISFAESVDGEDWPELANHVAPEAYAEYKQARTALLARMPFLDALPFDHPWTKMDEAALGLSCHAWMAGVRAGAAYENLRLALLSATRMCPVCHGEGQVNEHGRHDPRTDRMDPCGECHGRGTVPTPPLPPAAWPSGSTGGTTNPGESRD